MADGDSVIFDLDASGRKREPCHDHSPHRVMLPSHRWALEWQILDASSRVRRLLMAEGSFFEAVAERKTSSHLCGKVLSSHKAFCC